MEIKLESIGTTLVAKLSGEIDHHTAPQLRDALDREIAVNNTRNIVLDFDGVSFMDSSGIGIILGRYKKITCFQGKVYAIHVSPQIRKILHMSGLQRIIEILEDK